jgi:hypothetical protein
MTTSKFVSMAKRVLVIHPNQTSPDYNLLKVIYEGKGYDVIRDLNFSNEDLIKKSNRII